MYERRRLVVLGALTLLVLPIVWPKSGGESATQTTVTTSTAAPEVGGVEIPSPVYLGGPAPIAPSGTAAIAYPQVIGNTITGLATYVTSGYAEKPICSAIDAPNGVTITVTNINNGRKITCTNIFSLLVPNGISVVMYITVFQKLADVVDAPIPVKITW